MRFWILQTGEPLQIDGQGLRPMRAINLSNELAKRGHKVTLWSSDFDHSSKVHRYGKTTYVNYSDHIKINLIASRGYRKNIGISRLVDHFQLGLNLWKMQKKELKPDLGFIGYPPIEPAWIMTRFLSKNSVPTVLDVKDAWPEVLLRAFPRQVRHIALLLLLPYFKIRKWTFKSSTYFSAISPKYLDWALNVLPRTKQDFDKINYLSSPESTFTQNEIQEAEVYWDSIGIKDDGTFRCSYIGSLSSTLDFQRVFEAARETGAEFIIAGRGSMENEFKVQANNLRNVRFTGWISAAQASVLAKRSSFLVAPYLDLEDFKISLPNKFLDSMMHGRPIVSSLSGFPKEFIETNNIGRHYSINQTGSLTNLVFEFSSNRQKVIDMGLNARSLFAKFFSGEIVYSELANYLEEIVRLANGIDHV